MSAISPIDQSTVLSLSTAISGSELTSNLTVIIALLGVYVIPVTWLTAWFVLARKGRERLLSSLAAGVIAWQGINALIKLIYYQPRPIHSLPIRELLFERPDNSFPSDHTAFLAGIAFFFLLQKQRSVGFTLLFITIITSIARIAVAVHYPSDIVAGLVTGAIAALFMHALHPLAAKTVWERILVVAQKIRLA